MAEFVINLERRGMGADFAVLPQRNLRRPEGDLVFRSGGLPDAFTVSSFLDELAVADDKEPLQFLLSMLAHGRGLNPQLWRGSHDRGDGSAHQDPINVGRMRNVLLLAAARSGWRSPLHARQGRGIAAYHTARIYIATIARVAVADDGRVRAPRIDLAVDCGMVTDADRVAEALKAAALTALSNTLHRAPTLKGPDGKDQPSVLDDASDIRIHIVRSAEPSGGLGEAAVPSALAAIVNAVFAATGQRVRTLPVDPSLLRLH